MSNEPTQPLAAIRPTTTGQIDLSLTVTKDDVLAIRMAEEETKIRAEMRTCESALRACDKKIRELDNKIDAAFTELRNAFISQINGILSDSPGPFPFGITLNLATDSVRIERTPITGTVPGVRPNFDTPLPNDTSYTTFYTLVFDAPSSSDNEDAPRKEPLSQRWGRFSKQLVPKPILDLYEEARITFLKRNEEEENLLRLRRDLANLPSLERQARAALAQNLLNRMGEEGTALVKALVGTPNLPSVLSTIPEARNPISLPSVNVTVNNPPIVTQPCNG